MSKKKNKSKKIRPEVLRGFRDYPPSEEIARQKMVTVFRDVFESFGFSPLQTPSLEKIETLKGADYGDDNLATIFNFVGPEKVDMALRFELTASLARYVAGNPEMPLPFRRYQIGPVWRVDKPGPGRFREFTQFDIDTVGTESMLADAEIMAAIAQSFDNLGIENYKIKYSNRKILNGLFKMIGVLDDKAPDVFRVIDKLEKQGIEAVKLELGLGRTDRSGDKIKGLELEKDQITSIMEFLEMTVDPNRDALQFLVKIVAREVISDPTLNAESGLLGVLLASEAGRENLKEGVEEIKQIQSYLASLGVSDDKAQVDLTIVRGLGYYTGPVFEAILTDLPDYGSVFAGGRYDGLVERFTGKKIPAVGASAGVDRLLAALVKLGKIKVDRTISQVLVTVMDKEQMAEYITVLNEIRKAGIRAEIFLGQTKSFTKQMKYADRVGIPVAVIIGSDEIEQKTVTIKNLIAGGEQAQNVADREEWLKAENIQVTIPRSDMITNLKSLLDNIKKL